MDNLKLKWKIFGFLIGFCSLLLLILWLFQTVFLTDMYKAIRKNEIEKAINYVNENINSDDLQSIFYEIEKERDILITPSKEFLELGLPIKPKPDDKRKQETLTKTKEFVLDDEKVISLTFHARITPVEATVSTLKMQLYIITGIMIGFSVLLAIVIAKNISKPIEQINNSAKILSSGNYDIKFNGKGFLEIKELSDTLNMTAKELSKVENLRRELLANISHDLRTPLALIYSYAEMMQDFQEEITNEQIQTIMDETKRLSSLVDDVLEISKIEKGETTFKMESYNLTESVKTTIQRISEMTKKEGYIINFEYDHEIFVLADEKKITQVLYNLLINAINYCGENKKVDIIQSTDKDLVKIAVKDYGEGISQEELPYVWNRYYKSDKSHKRAITGTGLGLSIVKNIIELHEGSYGVESQKNEGSCFWFSIKASI